MANMCRKMTRDYILSIALALSSILLVTDPLLAQQNKPKPPPSSREAYEAARARERNLRERSMEMERLRKEQQQSEKHKQALVAQIREDFKRIQLVNNEMMQSVSNNRMLDYKSISDATAEINKCAKRLKMNLAIPDVKDNEGQKKPDTFDAKQVKAALLELDTLIMNFVTNLGTVNSQDADKASRDLKGIIELSDDIRKSAERLQKDS